MVIAPTEFKQVRSSVSADKRGRIVLGNEAKEKDYSVSMNDKGQVLLTPIVHIPEYEAWLYKNPEALELVRVGLAEAAAGLATPMRFPSEDNAAATD